MVIWVGYKVYIFGSMTLKTTHVRGKVVYNGGITLKLSRCFRVRSLHMCGKFRGSTTYRCREFPTGGGFDLDPLDFSSKFHLSYKVFKFLFFNQHVLNRVSLPADDSRRQCSNISIRADFCPQILSFIFF